MTAQFPIVWEGFSSAEVGKLKKLWSAYSFPRQFSRDFRGVVTIGSPGVIFIEAENKRLYREHWRLEINFSSLENLAQQAADLVTKSSVKFPEPADALTV